MELIDINAPKVGDQVGPFQLISLLGQGGYGLVFRAEHIRLEDDFAVKFLMPSFARSCDSESLSTRFIREVSFLKKLRHPHIVRVVDVGRSEHGLPYYAMEFVEGSTLSEVIRTEPLSVVRVAHITQQILSALENAHAAGIIHRDLKPSNIILRHDYGWDDYVTIIDFGIAKLLDADVELTASDQPVGSPQYLSPEQLKNTMQLDGRADLYSLGLIMAECLTGQSVVSSIQPLGAALAHVMPTPHDHDIVVRQSPLFPIIDRATQKDRDNRYQSANKMRLALESTGVACVLPATPLSFRETTDVPKQTIDLPKTLPLLSQDPPTQVDQLQPPATGQTYQPASLGTDRFSESATAAPKLWILTSILVGLAAVVVFGLWLIREQPTSTESEEEIPANGRAEVLETGQHAQTISDDVEGEAGSREAVENDDGVQSRQVTFESSDNPPSWSALSPDGLRIAFATTQGLTLFDVENQTSTLFPRYQDRGVLFFDWFPDGQSLITEEVSPDATRSLWRFSTVDGERVHIENEARAPGLSPDGRFLAYWADGRIAVRDLVTDEIAGTYDLHGRQPFEGLIEWSPNGEVLAFLTVSRLDDCPSATLHTVVLASGQLVAVVDGPQLCIEQASGSVVWLPDGRVVFSRVEAANALGLATSNLWSLAVDPTTGEALSEPTRLTDTHGFHYLSLSASADGSIMGFTRFGRQPSVNIISLDEQLAAGSVVRRLTSDGFHLSPAGWSVDGESLFLTTGRAGTFDIVALDVRTGEFRPQVTGDDWDWLATSAPDGNWLLYWETTLNTDGHLETSQIMRMPLAGGSSVPTTEPYLAWHPPFHLSFRCPQTSDSPCVFSEFEGQDLVFRWLDPIEGLGERIISINLPSRTPFPWDLSPDASQIVIGFSNRLLVGNLEYGTWTELPTRLQTTITGVSWDANSMSILISTIWGRELNRVDLTSDIFPVYGPSQSWVLAPLASPSGQHVAILETQWDLNVWMLEGL